MVSLFFTGYFKQYRIKNSWSPPRIEPRTARLQLRRSAYELRQPNIGGDQIFLIQNCFLKKACERERIHLMSKKGWERSCQLYPNPCFIFKIKCNSLGFVSSYILLLLFLFSFFFFFCLFFLFSNSRAEQLGKGSACQTSVQFEAAHSALS